MKCWTLLKFSGVAYLVFTIYTLCFIIYRDHYGKANEKAQKHVKQVNSRKHPTSPLSQINSREKTIHHAEIWGKAAIGLYLWQHIFEAPLERINGDYLKQGEILLEDIKFVFRTGPMISPQTVNPGTKNAILVINGRQQKKINFALEWLQAIKHFKEMRNLAVVLLGNEQCNNEWLMPFMAKNGGFIKFAFIVYDAPYIDNINFYQWPLGVATYRDFPIVHSNDVIRMRKRKYICNFIGTVYDNSSRITLIKAINSNQNLKENCFLHVRRHWLASETKETSELYKNAMRNSDLTLSPVGKNTECYRIYEAISYGSIPVVEDIMTPGICGKSKSDEVVQTPLRILKELQAPIIYIKTWQELPDIISTEQQHTYDYIVKRRTDLLQWYQIFKYKLRNQFVKHIKHGFDFK